MTEELINFDETNHNLQNELESPEKTDNFILNYKTNNNL